MTILFNGAASINYKLLTVNYKLVTVYHGSVSLMCSKNQNLSYLHMFWSTCSIEGYISYVIAVQRLYAAVNVVCAVLVTMETDVREVGFNQTRFHIGNTHFRMCHINAQAVSL